MNIDQYRTVAKSPFEISATVTVSDDMGRSLPQCTTTPFFQLLKSTPISISQCEPQISSAKLLSNNGCSEPISLPSPVPIISLPPSQPSSSSSSLPPSHAAPSSTAPSPPSPVSPLLAPPSLRGPLFSLETCIVMFLCGEPITYDLEALDEDPQAIIALLKATSSERGHWMIVAGQYRRKGNPSAAITVMTAMIEVMTANGVPEVDIKPAFLMLSGCETDLWKRRRPTGGAESEVSLGYYNRSRQWLQKVYGTQYPQSPPQPTNAPGHKCSGKPRAQTKSGTLLARLDPAAGSAAEPSVPTTASSPHDPMTQAHGNQHPQCLSQSTNAKYSGGSTAETTPSALQARPDAAEVPSTPTLASSPRDPRTSPTSVQKLRREVQSLRNRYDNQTALIKEARSAKRRIEGDYASERNLRRKLEKHLDDLNNELSLARRSETYALDQLKREAEARRIAEDNLDVERDRRREVERLAEQRTAKPLYEDLAQMFQRAAQGDEMVFGGTGTAFSNYP